MNCEEIRTHIDDYLDGTLSPEAEQALREHVTACPECATALAEERELRRALRELPVPAPTTDLVAGARERARRRNWHRWLTGVGSVGLAASLLLAFLFGPLQLPGPGQSAGQTAAPASVALSPGQTERVKLVFNSPRAMSQVTLRVKLPEGVELAGYSGRRELEWQTPLQAGRNLLELPVVLRGTSGGRLQAGIQYDGQQRHFHLELEPRPDRESGMIPTGKHV